jgi:hypothetical protein
MLLSVGLLLFYDDDMFANIADAVTPAGTIAHKLAVSKPALPKFLWPSTVLFPGKYGIRSKQKALS